MVRNCRFYFAGVWLLTFLNVVKTVLFLSYLTIVNSHNLESAVCESKSEDICHYFCYFSDEYYGMDHDAYENTVTQECLQKSGHQLNDQGTYESQSSYNPYNLHMGQMTVYR